MSANSLIYVFVQNIRYQYLIYYFYISPQTPPPFSVFTELLQPICENQLKSYCHVIDVFSFQLAFLRNVTHAVPLSFSFPFFACAFVSCMQRPVSVRFDTGPEILNVLSSQMFCEIRHRVEKGDFLDHYEGRNRCLCYLSEILLEKSCYEWPATGNAAFRVYGCRQQGIYSTAKFSFLCRLSFSGC